MIVVLTFLFDENDYRIIRITQYPEKYKAGICGLYAKFKIIHIYLTYFNQSFFRSIPWKCQNRIILEVTDESKARARVL